jgi:hypothetical protein
VKSSEVIENWAKWFHVSIALEGYSTASLAVAKWILYTTAVFYNKQAFCTKCACVGNEMRALPLRVGHIAFWHLLSPGRTNFIDMPWT